MTTHYDDFIDAIHLKKLVSVTINTENKGTIIRKCIPFDFGPSRKYKDGLDRYHFWDIDSPEGSHNLSILPEQLMNIGILDEEFNPSDYISWTPNWYIKRNWGSSS
jgi:hypothetical protein